MPPDGRDTVIDPASCQASDIILPRQTSPNSSGERPISCYYQDSSGSVTQSGLEQLGSFNIAAELSMDIIVDRHLQLASMSPALILQFAFRNSPECICRARKYFQQRQSGVEAVHLIHRIVLLLDLQQFASESIVMRRKRWVVLR